MTFEIKEWNRKDFRKMTARHHCPIVKIKKGKCVDEAGISVITTVNVQHLESLNDAVEQLTGVRVRETVQDAILKMANEVELIDITPQMLQERMREGKIYGKEKIDQALNSFFKMGNLIALRELALREIADDVDERLKAWESGCCLTLFVRKRQAY